VTVSLLYFIDTASSFCFFVLAPFKKKKIGLFCLDKQTR
jgi:hypothetical protein